MRPKRVTLTDQELEIMKIVWDLEEATVRDVYEKLLEHRKIAYTTVMTLMKILETKGHLKKCSDERAYVYRPSQPKQQVIGGMVREFVNRVFNGSAEPLLLHLVEDEGLSEKELAELVRLAREEVMSTYLANLLAWCIQVSIIAAVAASLPSLFRLKASKARLWYWHIVLLLLLTLPILQPWLTPLPTASRVSVTSGQFRVAGAGPAAGLHISWQFAGLYLLATGTAVRLLFLSFGLFRLRRYRLNASPSEESFANLRRQLAPRAEILVSAEVSSPVTFGYWDPVILLPDRFRDLATEEQRSIVCHELIHIRRRDWPVAIAEEVVRSMLWFHPAFWWLLGQIQLTREQVVDEAVIEHTGDRSRYLDALLAIASLHLSADLAPAPLFLKKRHLRQRVESIVTGVNMTKRNLLLPLAAAFATLPIVIGIAVWQFPLHAAPQEAADDSGVDVQLGAAKVLHRSGIAYPEDARSKQLSGTVVANVTVDDKGEVTSAQAISGPDELRETVVRAIYGWHFAADSANNTHSFQIAVLFDGSRATQPAWPSAPDTPRTVEGISLGRLPVALRDKVSQAAIVHVGDVVTNDTLRSIEAALHNIDSHLGLTADVHGDKLNLIVGLAGARLAQAGPNGPIRVGGNVQAANIVTKITPRYPPDAKQARVQGTVRFSVLIGTDGTVKNIDVVSGDPMLVPAAMDAVKQWVYKPTLLNGNPVDVITTVDINFTLSQ